MYGVKWIKCNEMSIFCECVCKWWGWKTLKPVFQENNRNIFKIGSRDNVAQIIINCNIYCELFEWKKNKCVVDFVLFFITF